MNASTRPPLLSLDDALQQLLVRVSPLGRTESVSTFDADGRVLAEDIVSELKVPAFDNSAMDGYALRLSDLAQGDALQAAWTLPCRQRVPAGQSPSALPEGSVARIFTGAPIPKGADAVVMQEDCTDLGEEGGVSMVRINVLPTQLQNIRRAGEDVQNGAIVLARGTRLSPAELGLAASVGMASLRVAAKPRVALFSTGDELVMPGEVAPADMRAGSIYNSNRFFLRALLLRMGCEVTDFGIVPDDRSATVKALSDAASGHDLILSSGGVSVGEEDHIKPAVQQLGELNLWQIAIKPGKPFAFGKVKLVSDTHSFVHFVGLPGNPVSSFATFLLLVRPLLLQLQGIASVALQSVALRADFDWPRADKRREFLRARRNTNGGLDLFPNQSSGVLTSAVWGDGLVDNAANQIIKRGDMVSFLSFAELLT
jgi:molybdopterin molybdotransferase